MIWIESLVDKPKIEVDTPPFQFSLATALCVVTAFAILCALARWNRAFPYWTILPGVFFVASCLVARRRKSPDLAWGLFAIAWLIALCDAVNGFTHCFSWIGGPPSASNLQAGFVATYVSGLLLPLFLSLPAVYLAVKASKGARSFGRKWILACVAVSLGDVTLLTVWLIVLIGYTWPLLWP